jgi:hypothetical protein
MAACHLADLACKADMLHILLDADTANENIKRVTRRTNQASAPDITSQSQVLSHVNTKRGQTSFAPSDFKFSALSHLAYDFRPLSPNSAAMFLRPSSANSSLAAEHSVNSTNKVDG